jgi:heptosyltransferase-1
VTSTSTPALPHPPPARRILVIRLGALGDVVRTLPAVRALRAHYPDAHLAWLVESKSAGALERNSDLDELLIFPREEITASVCSARFPSMLRRLARVAATLRNEHFDLVLDFHSILKSGVLSRLTGAPLRIAYAKPHARESAQRFATHRVALAPAKMSRFERNLGLVRGIGIEAWAASPASFAHRGESVKRMREFVASLLGESTRAVVIHPGTSDSTPYKRYDAVAYGAVARALRDAHGVRTLVTSGSSGPVDAVTNESELAQRVVDASDGAAILAPGTPTVTDLAALFSACDLFIGSDSGPLHLASQSGLPVVQLLGPTDPIENQPWSGTPSRSVRVPVVCSPCRRGCESASCMRAIPPSRVATAAGELLKQLEDSGFNDRAAEPKPARASAQPTVRYFDDD